MSCYQATLTGACHNPAEVGQQETSVIHGHGNLTLANVDIRQHLRMRRHYASWLSAQSLCFVTKAAWLPLLLQYTPITLSMGCLHMGQGVPGCINCAQSRHTHLCTEAPCRNPTSLALLKQITHSSASAPSALLLALPPVRPAAGPADTAACMALTAAPVGDVGAA